MQIVATFSGFKRLRLLIAQGAIVGACAVSPLRAQTAVSNLGQETAVSLSVARTAEAVNYGRAFNFTTGAAPVEFTGVSLAVGSSAPNTGTGFTVSLHSGFSSAGSTGLLATLSGATAPAATDVYSYAVPSPVLLEAGTTYWLQVAAFATAPNTYFFLRATTSTEEDADGLAGWSIGNSVWFSADGGNFWDSTAASTRFIPRFAVEYQAVAIPESATGVLATGLAALGFAGWRRIRRAFLIRRKTGDSLHGA